MLNAGESWAAGPQGAGLWLQLHGPGEPGLQKRGLRSQMGRPRFESWLFLIAFALPFLNLLCNLHFPGLVIDNDSSCLLPSPSEGVLEET